MKLRVILLASTLATFTACVDNVNPVSMDTTTPDTEIKIVYPRDTIEVWWHKVDDIDIKQSVTYTTLNEYSLPIITLDVREYSAPYGGVDKSVFYYEVDVNKNSSYITESVHTLNGVVVTPYWMSK